MDETMDKFYEQIMLVSEMHKNPEPDIDEIEYDNENEKIVLEMHIEEMMELICENYKDNIRVAAERGDTKAIICLYQEKTAYRRIINVHKLLYPHKALFEKYNTYEIPLLMDRLQEKFQPFKVIVKPLEEVIDWDPNHPDYYAIIVEWGT